jgi:hypothetical protein
MGIYFIFEMMMFLGLFAIVGSLGILIWARS